MNTNYLPDYEQARKFLEKYREEGQVLITLQEAYNSGPVTVNTVARTKIRDRYHPYMLHDLLLCDCSANGVLGQRFDSATGEWWSYDFPVDYPCLIESSCFRQRS
jgi:hypothetical protein